MSLTREQMLAEMGLAPIWRLREAAAAAPAPETAHASDQAPTAAGHVVARQAPASAPVNALEWPDLAAGVAACKACPLCQQRKQAVLGVGDLNPDWLFVGEGPGAEEDVKGEPFVGQAGKLLDNMLAALGIARGRGTATRSISAMPSSAGHPATARRKRPKWRPAGRGWSARSPC